MKTSKAYCTSYSLENKGLTKGGDMTVSFSINKKGLKKGK